MNNNVIDTNLITYNEEIYADFSDYDKEIVKKTMEYFQEKFVIYLTPQQNKIYNLYQSGKNVSEIAHILKITQPTVTQHIKSIIVNLNEKLQVVYLTAYKIFNGVY